MCNRGVKGHVSYRAQKALLVQVQAWLSPEAGVLWLGDAGFRAMHLLRWLQAHGWHWVLRQPGHTQVSTASGTWIALPQLALHRGHTRASGWVRCTQRHAAGPFWLTLHWGQSEKELWFLLSDTGPGPLGAPVRRYRTRMWTEEMYGDMKRHGFDLEATRLGHPHRLARLLRAVCLATVWLLSLGSWVVKLGSALLAGPQAAAGPKLHPAGLGLGMPVFVPLLPYFR